MLFRRINNVIYKSPEKTKEKKNVLQTDTGKLIKKIKVIE